MKFKLVEYITLSNVKAFIQDFAYEAIDELGNKDLRDYLRWFDDQLEYYDLDKELQEVAVKDFYINAIDCGKIDLPKTMITSELTTYLEANADLIDKDIDELINNCPAHLQHELKIVLSKLEESLNEELLTEEQVIYKVTHPKYPEPVFFNVTKTVDKTTEDDTTNDVAERKFEAIFDSLEHKKKVNGETPNYDLLAKLINCDDDLANYILAPSPETKLADLTKNNMLMLTLSTWRKQARNNSTIKHIVNKLNIGNDYLVHHKDGKEWNNDDVKNFLIVPKSNATDNEEDFRSFIHTSLHMIMKSGKGDGSQKSKSFPLYYVNDENEVCRTYLTLQLHTNKKLFELS